MALNFANAKAFTGGLIPENTLALVKLEVRELKTSTAGNVYISLLGRIYSGKYEGRVVFGQVMLTEAGGTAPAGVGYSQVKATLECKGLSAQSNPEAFIFETFEQVAEALHGAVIGALIGVEAGSDGKKVNKIGLFLSPDDSSGTSDLWLKMMDDVHPAGAAAAQ